VVSSELVQSPAEVSSSAHGDLDKSKISITELKPSSWINLFYQLDLDGITRSIAANFLLQEVSGKKLVFVMDDTQSTVFNEEQQRRINQALNTYFSDEVSLQVGPGEINTETPAAWQQRMDKERLAEAIQTFKNDATVKEIVERFSGAIETDSIEPTKPKQY